MNRNITIVVIILVFVVIAAYLVWLRAKVASPAGQQVTQVQEVTPSPSSSPVLIASPSATPSVKEATSSTKQKSSTSSSTTR